MDQKKVAEALELARRLQDLLDELGFDVVEYAVDIVEALEEAQD